MLGVDVCLCCLVMFDCDDCVLLFWDVFACCFISKLPLFIRFGGLIWFDWLATCFVACILSFVGCCLIAFGLVGDLINSVVYWWFPVGLI